MATISGLIGFAAVLLSTQVAQISELQNGFDKDLNPRGDWSFGFGKTPTSFEAYKDNRQVGDFYAKRGQSELRGWCRPEGVFPFAACNMGQETYYQRWRPSDVVLHPSADLFSVARSTNSGSAPVVAHLYVTFRRVENVTGNVPEWYVVSKGSVVDSGDLLLGDEAKSVTEVVKVAPGGSVAVVVGCKDHQPDGTDLNLQVTVKATAH